MEIFSLTSAEGVFTGKGFVFVDAVGESHGDRIVLQPVYLVNDDGRLSCCDTRREVNSPKQNSWHGKPTINTKIT